MFVGERERKAGSDSETWLSAAHPSTTGPAPRRGGRPRTTVVSRVAVALVATVALVLPLATPVAAGEPRSEPTVDPGGDDGPDAPPEAGDADEPSPAELYVELLGELNRELEELDAAIADAKDRQRELRRDSAELEDQLDDTDATIDDAGSRIVVLEAILRERMAGTYMAEGTEVAATFDPEVDQGLIRRIYAEAQSETDDRIARRLVDQRERLSGQRDDLADQETELADQRRELDRLVESLGDQQAERAAAAVRLEAAIAEAQRQALLAAAEAIRRAEEAAEAARRAEEAAVQALLKVAAARDEAQRQAFLATARRAQEAAELAAAQLATASQGASVSRFAPGGIRLCVAGGITVNCLIAPDVSRMLLEAAADGVALSGSGYRSTQHQIQLRAAHCVGDVYGRPASACSPPTARPGSSLHEIGLAIDFHRCSSRSTPCWVWLDEHAHEYGLTNLPSEPWHWSTTGG